jgi:hypothetical protein
MFCFFASNSAILVNCAIRIRNNFPSKIRYAWNLSSPAELKCGEDEAKWNRYRLEVPNVS